MGRDNVDGGIFEGDVLIDDLCPEVIKLSLEFVTEG
jgi:hypothetical protein